MAPHTLSLNVFVIYILEVDSWTLFALISKYLIS